MEIDYLRQLSIFDPAQFNKNKSVTVIGAGATGSYVTFMLAQMGITKINVWDFDKVEEHNLPNQMFMLKHIGMPKVEALKSVVKEKCDIDINTHNEEVVNQNITASYVFILTDTMKSRKEIFDNCLKLKSFNTDLVIETRMDADNGRIYAFNPSNPVQVKAWEDTLYDDKDASISACGASVSIVPTVALISSFAIWKLIHNWDVLNGPNNAKRDSRSGLINNETIFQVGPEDIMNRRF